MAKVKLITNTPDPEQVIATAAKLCYSQSDISTLKDDLTPEKSKKFIERLMSMGHESPLEHISFTFGVEGISRACSHQLVRHRIASYSQQSQRYVNMSDFDYITPPNIKSNREANLWYQELIEQITRGYSLISGLLVDSISSTLVGEGMNADEARKKAEKMANEDARFILPNACETKIVITMNARSLLNFFAHRCCNRAQWEIRDVADQMYKICYSIAPTVFEHAGPRCISENKCPEGKMCCGKTQEIRAHFQELRKDDI